MDALNENIFEISFKNASEGLVLVDVDSKIILCNPRANELFGYAENELIGQPIEILVPRNVKDKHVHHRQGYNAAPKTRRMGGLDSELMGEKKDGSFFPVEVSLNHFVLNEKQFVLAFVTDITERKKSDEALESARNELYKMNKELETIVHERTIELVKMQQLYMQISRNFPDGTINVVDNQLNYVFVEGKDLFKYGLTSQLLIGTSYLERMPKAIVPNLKEKLLNAFLGQNSVFEISINNNYYELNIVGLKDQDDTIEQLLIVEHNVTKKRLAALEQEKALQQEKEIGELKSRFVSMASHEFRTPLSAILSSAALIDKYPMLEQHPHREKHTKRIKDSVSNLTSILNDFLSLDKLSSGKVAVNLSWLNPKEVIEATLEEIEVLKKQNQTINYTHIGLENDCETDEKIFKNIVINFTSNAIKYSNDDGVIQIVSSLKNNMLSVKVIDNGMGIPVAEQDLVFDRFFRARNVTNIQGTGLGLNIVKKYVELLDGEIHFESIPNQKTEFRISIPVKIAAH